MLSGATATSSTRAAAAGWRANAIVGAVFGMRIAAPSFRKTLLKLQLPPRWLSSAGVRLAFTSGVSANQVCFERKLLDH